jgi:hypothetical protein
MYSIMILVLSSTLSAPPPLVRGPMPVNPGAGDIQALSRPVPDRPPLEDPTAAALNKRAMFTAFPKPTGTMSFFRWTIPNPFEYAEQLTGKLPREKEFGTTPVVIPPEKK